MDEQLKARLIGGAVLVALVVLLVPELLSGRKTTAPEPAAVAGNRGTRTYTIDLGGGAPVEVTAEPERKQPEPAAQPRAEAKQPPEAEQRPEARPEPAPAPAAVAEPAAPEPRPEVQPATPPVQVPDRTAVPTKKGGWAVQVGAFGSADAAGKLVRELDAAGFEAYEAPVTRAGKTLHRVRVGPEAERAGADRLASRLKARGLPATVVAND